ncbi:MAG: spermidine/putrescine ABC transporter substrate-binding protein [Streptomycetaceae bacterium]|nr:MAG: spermidine/putrescine ABC transporter substrate-binding protein [Streptomycetaceae bacterium]
MKFFTPKIGVAIALAAAVSLGLSACGSSAKTDTAASSSEFPTANGGEVNLYNWTNYIDPEQLKAFTAETGIKVNLDTFDSNETLLAKLQAGATGYDVIVPSDYMVAQMVSLGLLENVGVASFPNGKNIDPNFMDVYWDKGRQYSAPYMYGTTGIAVNTSNAAANKIASWKDFFAADSATSVDVLKDQTEVVSAALRATGVAAADLCTVDKSKYAAAQKLLEGFKPKVIDSDGGIERMVKESSMVRMAWNGSVHRMGVDNPKIKYVFPSEGLNFWADNLAIAKGAPNLDNAKIFINWMLSPKQGAVATNFTGYANAVLGSGDLLDPAIKADPAINASPENAKLATPTPNCPTEARDLYTEVFTSWTSSQ